jgi:beta-lactamase class D
MVATAQAQSCSSDCTFVLLSPGHHKKIALNPVRAKQPLPPFSSFKIANSLIAIERGVVDLKTRYSVDTNRYPEQSWWPARWMSAPLTLREAFQVSALPIYQQIAVDVGAEQMQHYVTQFDYGNQDISSGIDNFWLNGSLRISAEEQVRFLRKIYRQKLGLKASTMQGLREIMLAEDTGDYKLFAKTGGGPLTENSVLGWYVGYVEDAKGPHYFALNIEGENFNEVMAARKPLVMKLLREHGIID